LGNKIKWFFESKSDVLRNIVRTTLLLGVLLLAGASISQAQVSLGIRIGPPPHPRVVRVQPRSPGQGYSWIGGYWYPVGNHYKWHDGYWTRPPYEGAHWVEPRHDGQQYFAGYWDGDRGQLAHDHRWDKDHDNRDNGRYQDNDHHDNDHH
jgi:hypothetical protein